ncbi:hypothetical protein DAPPUDRAFT_337824 [Daphnia pulex]|uniref:Uncharacterized protein n=1 Tax=Daphnia pulex TaxID=6669 RepID=E9I260_DAPPU|nr:hypothetical protein DAPPUDRAFT_337824 [Daphnia pulex]|eukprot:EFX61919.1 hypothetical protein DAPPUDRAFT_337824 [Daphnia pulex]
MCLIKTRTKGNAQDGCHAAAAYASACAAKSVLLRIPLQFFRAFSIVKDQMTLFRNHTVGHEIIRDKQWHTSRSSVDS